MLLHGRQPILLCEAHDLASVRKQNRIRSRHNQRVWRAPFAIAEKALATSSGLAHFNELKLHAQRMCRALQPLCTSSAARRDASGFQIERYSGEPGNGFLEQLQPLAAELRGEGVQAGDIAARACARLATNPVADRIGWLLCHDNRGSCKVALLDCRNCPDRVAVKIDVHLRLHQLGGERPGRRSALASP